VSRAVEIRNDSVSGAKEVLAALSPESSADEKAAPIVNHVKSIAKSVLLRLGLELRRVPGMYALRTSLSTSYAFLRERGVAPRTVIDVGVADGTPELHAVFPEAFFLLIEPLTEYDHDIVRILRKYKGKHIRAAAGRESGTVTFNIHPNHIAGSSLYKETMGSAADGHEIEVAMVRLDDVASENNLVPPYLLKVDVQGAELDVLDGAQNILSDCEAVVLEVSLFQFMRGQPEFCEVIAYMKEREFVPYDIHPGWNRPLDGALGQVDVIFVPENCSLREDHSYGATEKGPY